MHGKINISIEKLKAIIGLAVDKTATDLIEGIADEELSMEDFSYSYKVLVEREHVSLEVSYKAKEILKTAYFYSLEGDKDGSIKISLSDSDDNNVLTIEFEPDYDFNKVIGNYS